MKKQDMIDKIKANYGYIEGVNERNVDPIYWPEGITRQVYLIPVFVPQGEKIIEKTFKFIVFDEGGASEEAFWLSVDPAPPAPEPTFQAEMMAWLLSKLGQQVGPYIIRHIESMTANNATQTGAANVVVEDGAGDCLRKSALVWQDAQDRFRFQVIKE